jgi:hypothetical protein
MTWPCSPLLFPPHHTPQAPFAVGSHHSHKPFLTTTLPRRHSVTCFPAPTLNSKNHQSVVHTDRWGLGADSHQIPNHLGTYYVSFPCLPCRCTLRRNYHVPSLSFLFVLPPSPLSSPSCSFLEASLYMSVPALPLHGDELCGLRQYSAY